MIKRRITLFVLMICMIILTSCANPQVVPTLTSEQIKHLLDAYRSGAAEDKFSNTIDEFNRQDVDINNDGTPEVLVDGTWDRSLPYLAILGYSSDTWRIWFYHDDVGRYCADHRAALVNHTFVVDLLTCNGGSGLFDAAWKQYEVDCVKEICSLTRQETVWRDGVGGPYNRLPITEAIKLPSELQWALDSESTIRFKLQSHN